MSKPLQVLAVAAAALAALGLGVWTANQLRSAPVELQSGILLPQPRPLADFTLTDHDGRAFSRADLQGRWSLLFAGFTHCPDVCPATLSLMKLLEQRLAAQNRPLNVVFLSVDPQRDAGERLKTYVRYFSPTLTGATGSPEALDRLCADLGIAYVKVPGASDADYTVDHSAALVLIDPQAQVAGYFQAPHRLEALAADLGKVIPAS